MHTIVDRRVSLVALALLATAGMAACSSHGAPANADHGNRQTASAAASPAATTQATSSPTAAPTATPAASGGIQNLVISSAVRSELTTAVVDYYGISPSELVGGGALSGTVYYAYDPADDTYWALAGFELLNTDPANVLSDFLSSDGNMMFREDGSGPWQVQPLTVGSQYVCNEVQFIPPAVLMAWSMPTTPAAGITC